MPSPAAQPSAVEEMAVQFRDLLRSMTGTAGLLDMESIVRFAAAAIAGADHAAVSLFRAGHEPTTIHATGVLPVRVDALQYHFGEGPCVSALSENDVVLVEDLAADDRYPRFAPCAVELGVRSMLSARLYLSAKDRAALNFYSAQPHAFTSEQIPLLAIFASFASLLLLNRLHEDQIMNLEQALRSNREIGVAMGILMAQQRLTSEEAFGQLAHASQRLNRRLRDIAAEVSHTGELPPIPDHD